MRIFIGGALVLAKIFVRCLIVLSVYTHFGFSQSAKYATYMAQVNHPAPIPSPEQAEQEGAIVTVAAAGTRSVKPLDLARVNPTAPDAVGERHQMLQL